MKTSTITALRELAEEYETCIYVSFVESDWHLQAISFMIYLRLNSSVFRALYITVIYVKYLD